MRKRVLKAGIVVVVALAGGTVLFEAALSHRDSAAFTGGHAGDVETTEIPSHNVSGGETEGPSLPEDPGESSLGSESTSQQHPTSPKTPASSKVQTSTRQTGSVNSGTLTAAIRSVETAGREVVLTFDDGPSNFTEEILSILEEEQVPAVFFWVAGKSQIQLAREVLASGNQLGSHTVGHMRLTTLGSRDRLEEMAQSLEILEAAGGAPVQYLRPPYGAYDAETLDIARELGIALVTWNVDSRDWELAANPDQIIVNVLNEVRPGSIILLHERQQTVQILPQLISALRDEGYTFGLLPAVESQAAPIPQTQQESAGVGPGGNAAVPVEGNPPTDTQGENALPEEETSTDTKGRPILPEEETYTDTKGRLILPEEETSTDTEGRPVLPEEETATDTEGGLVQPEGEASTNAGETPS